MFCFTFGRKFFFTMGKTYCFPFLTHVSFNFHFPVHESILPGSFGLEASLSWEDPRPVQHTMLEPTYNKYIGRKFFITSPWKPSLLLRSVSVGSIVVLTLEDVFVFILEHSLPVGLSLLVPCPPVPTGLDPIRDLLFGLTHKVQLGVRRLHSGDTCPKVFQIPEVLLWACTT